MNRSEYKSKIRNHYDKIALERDKLKKKNWYYHKEVERCCSFIVPPNSSVLEIGCGTGDLLNSLKPLRGLGIDISTEMISVAKKKFPKLDFQIGDAESLDINEKFDYVVMSDLVGMLYDVQVVFHNLKKVTKPETRIIITYYNYLWEPILKLAEKLGLKMKQELQNWLSIADLQGLLDLNNYEVIKKEKKFLFPKYIFLISPFINRFIANLPLINKTNLVEIIVAKEIVNKNNFDDYTCSVIIPCRNELGNIEGAVSRTPEMGKHTELIFIDGNSTDGTEKKIERLMEIHKEKDIKLIHQGDGIGKGDAVRKGFSAAKGDVLMILDADLTVLPEDLPKFWNALLEGKGEFINGSRLVYQMEGEAMRFLNILGNKLFSLLFSFLLGQRFKDTLCGTKVLLKKDYEKIVTGRSFFGDFDPFGDFDLIFGASKASLKIIELPVRYHDRTYGSTNISRFRHGWLLLKMSVVAMKKLKFF